MARTTLARHELDSIIIVIVTILLLVVINVITITTVTIILSLLLLLPVIMLADAYLNWNCLDVETSRHNRPLALQFTLTTIGMLTLRHDVMCTIFTSLLCIPCPCTNNTFVLASSSQFKFIAYAGVR